ncbi:unnamed protein product [Ixodes persulcatus]
MHLLPGPWNGCTLRAISTFVVRLFVEATTQVRGGKGAIVLSSIRKRWYCISGEREVVHQSTAGPYRGWLWVYFGQEVSGGTCITCRNCPFYLCFFEWEGLLLTLVPTMPV